MNTFVIGFDLTAAQINALDTTAIDLGEFGSSSPALVRVPVRAEVWRDAGTPYVIDNPSVPWDSDGTISGRSTGTVWGSELPTPAALDTPFALKRTIFPAKELWVRGVDRRGERGEILFRIPMGILENSTLSGMVVMPEPGQSYVGGTFGLSIQAGTPLASGTGSIHGLIYFNEFALPV